MQRRRGDHSSSPQDDKDTTRAVGVMDPEGKRSKKSGSWSLSTFSCGGGVLVFILAMLFYRNQRESPFIPVEQSAGDIVDTSEQQRHAPVEPGISSVQYHIVFSTGCSIYQDWQSFVFFYQAMAVKQPGTVTRIVSGCSEEEQGQLQKVFDEQIKPMAPTRFKIHFTPDYSHIKGSGPAFVYFNKPYGMRHWLQNELGFPNHPRDEDAIVILMDPDQLILRPFRNNDFSNTEWKFIPKDEQPRTKVEHGKPMGQMYGFGLQWKDKVDMKLVLPKGETSPINEMTRDEARAGYIVGPPYVATARDMYSIVTKWCEFAIPVHDQYPYLLAEMFAYCLAAAHLKLSHQTAISFMISDTDGGGEGWSYVDKLTDSDLCHPQSIEDVPNVIHFCQRYGLGKFFFGKRRLPKNFLTCEAPLLKEPTVADLATSTVHWPTGDSKEWNDVMAKRNRFMLCHLIPALNAAATYFKQHNCDTVKANFEKSYMFHD